MTKARLIKKQDVVERKEIKKPVLAEKKVVKQTVDSVVEWLEAQRDRREDPRKAFAALFAQPQTQG